MSKVLSIVIPSYNVESTLGETVDSMLSNDILEDLEILIVNDGSKDSTSVIGKEYEVKHPGTVRCINKENGGHGSTINTGMKEATGTYFKVVDGDDALITPNLVHFIQVLKETKADIVYNPFVMVNEQTAENQLMNGVPSSITPHKVYNFDDVSHLGFIQMHSITYRTALLKEQNIHIDEHRFYVDMEYDILPILNVHTIQFEEYPLYLYRCFTENQSMNIKNRQKNVSHHQGVVLRLASFYEENKAKLSKQKRAYVHDQLVSLIGDHYGIYLSFPYNNKIKEDMMNFDHELHETSNGLYEDSMGKSVKWIRKSPNMFYPLARVWTKLKEKKNA